MSTRNEGFWDWFQSDVTDHEDNGHDAGHDNGDGGEDYYHDNKNTNDQNEDADKSY